MRFFCLNLCNSCPAKLCPVFQYAETRIMVVRMFMYQLKLIKSEVSLLAFITNTNIFGENFLIPLHSCHP